MSNNVTEFVGGEVCTATIFQPMEPGGEAYAGPIHVGHYPSEEGTKELWLEFEGARINISEKYLPDLIKQLKRALRIAKGE